MKHYISLIFCITFCASGHTSEQNTLHQLTNEVFYIEGGNGKGANAGVIVAEDAIILIDTMTADSNRYLTSNISQITKKPVKYVFNTHDHFDHTGNNLYFFKNGATIIANENSIFEQDFALIGFQNKMSFRHKNITIDGYGINSHSASDVLYYLPNQNIIFLGDIYTDEWYPSFFSGGLRGQKNAIELAISLGNDNTKYIPGHGQVASIKELEEYALNCEKWVRRIMKLLSDGIEPTAMLEDSDILDIRENFTSEKTNRENFDKWLEMLIVNTIEIEQRNSIQ